MAWGAVSMINQKQKFIALWESHTMKMKDLCTLFKISRPTGYAIVERYEEEGWDALLERSRRHFNHPLKTSKSIEEYLVGDREKHPRYGCRKLRYMLHRDHGVPEEELPSETTVNNILKRNGLIAVQRKALRRIRNQYPYFDPQEPNEIWSADFKGKFRLGNKSYCYPLTIADSKTRLILAIEGLEKADTDHSKPIFEKVFSEYGLPEFLHTDNGAPFGNSMSLRRMTRLSVWLMDLGVTPVYSDPAHPEQNGRHERMHRELKAEVTRPASNTLKAQQHRFDRFREEYNTVRPHEALEMKTPAEVHKSSERVYTRKVQEWSYEKSLQTRLVTVNGAIRWNVERFVMVSTALSGRYVGVEEVDNGVWALWYRHVQLGYYSERENKVYEVEDWEI